ncbi:MULTISPECIES: DUF4843 domain-containing protein [Sphingobacterium]|uniref:DUF4843 domain-containing protein n=1 Tax=Sphingobacterium TaxID=28453 RepID=UPI0013DC3443|nr:MULTISPECIES: DUF4843 domain-containing protein [unclassified Sphingobacterium]
MKAYSYFLIACISTMIYSCKKNPYMYFQDIARLQFGPDVSRIYDNNYRLSDSLKRYTFYYEGKEIQQDTVFFDLYASGGVSAHDRSFQLVQEDIPGVMNAIPGKHYKAFSDPTVVTEYVINAGKVRASVPIVLLRDPSLKESTVSLKLKLVANDNFGLGETNNLWRKVEWTDRLSQPTQWDASITQYHLGNYSIKKHQFIIDVTGQKWDDEFIKSIRTDNGLLSYWKSVISIAVVNYNIEHPGEPLRDENRELIVFP